MSVLFLGDTASYLAAEEEEPYSCDDTILSISCNIDDMTGEALGLTTEIFMAAGALDVFTIPIQMKKNRPGILLTCLCEMEEREKFHRAFLPPYFDQRRALPGVRTRKAGIYF